MNTTISNGIPLRIKVGDKDLISSGIIHLEQDEFELTISGLTIIFRFKTDDGAPRFEGNISPDNKLVMSLLNHNNALGEGIFSPIEIAKCKKLNCLGDN